MLRFFIPTRRSKSLTQKNKPEFWFARNLTYKTEIPLCFKSVWLVAWNQAHDVEIGRGLFENIRLVLAIIG